MARCPYHPWMFIDGPSTESVAAKCPDCDHYDLEGVTNRCNQVDGSGAIYCNCSNPFHESVAAPVVMKDWQWYDKYLRASGYTDLANRMLTEFRPDSERSAPVDEVSACLAELREMWPGQRIEISIEFNGHCYITRSQDRYARALADGESLSMALRQWKNQEAGKSNE